MEEKGETIELEVEDEEEVREVKAWRDPGRPTKEEVAKHNITHMPFRAWCAACVGGKAKDRLHHSVDGGNKEVPQVVFDYMMGGEGDSETAAIQVTKDRRSRMIFAHVVPRKGMIHAHGAAEMLKDMEKLGYHEVILKSDGEPALKAIQKEVRERREKPTMLENSPAGDSCANGAAERAVQAVGGQVRVLKFALENRLGIKLPVQHCLFA